MGTGVVYTETVVHLAPERFAADVPYQVAIVTSMAAAASPPASRASASPLTIACIEIDTPRRSSVFRKA